MLAVAIRPVAINAFAEIFTAHFALRRVGPALRITIPVPRRLAFGGTGCFKPFIFPFPGRGMRQPALRMITRITAGVVPPRFISLAFPRRFGPIVMLLAIPRAIQVIIAEAAVPGLLSLRRRTPV
ncbi:MAG: hypothetical protein WA851_26435 [Xanthobacteraceae bacterium]